MGLLMGQYLDSRPLPGGHYLAGLAGCPRSTAQEVCCDAPVSLTGILPIKALLTCAAVSDAAGAIRRTVFMDGISTKREKKCGK